MNMRKDAFNNNLINRYPIGRSVDRIQQTHNILRIHLAIGGSLRSYYFKKSRHVFVSHSNIGINGKILEQLRVDRIENTAINRFEYRECLLLRDEQNSEISLNHGYLSPD